MKLLFIHDGPLFFDNEGNYYEFAYHELYERYSFLADDITFMMRTKKIEGSKQFTPVPNQIRVVNIPNFKSIGTYFTQKKKAELIVKEQIKITDYVVLRSQSSIAQLALPYIIKYGKPYIIESVGCSWDSYWNHGLLGKAIAPYMYIKTRSAIKRADYVYYVTTEFLQKRYPTKGNSVCCSNVVLEPLDVTTLEQRLKKLEKFNPLQKVVIGTAAALDTRYKGQEYVIKAIPELTRLGYNVEYRLAGGIAGQRQNTFLLDLTKKYGVSDRVFFCGSLSSLEMSAYYDSLDIYIQPSKQEGLPRAIIEAMSRGCPVIGTNIAGIPELISPEFLFKKGSISEVVSAIRKIVAMDLNSIAVRNFKKSKEFEKSKLDEKREKFYTEFLSDIRQRD